MPLSMGAKDVIAKRMADYIGHGMAEKCDVFAEVALKMMTEVYNAGYAAGHHDTVEGYYVTVLDRDKKTYMMPQEALPYRDCANCLFSREDWKDGGFCYMFRIEPEGTKCGQFKRVE